MRRLLSSILFTALIATAVEAQTIRKVPQDFSTIQGAIVAAQNGDTVRVAPGVYVENINFLGKAITVVSEAGPNFTTIASALETSTLMEKPTFFGATARGMYPYGSWMELPSRTGPGLATSQTASHNSLSHDYLSQPVDYRVR